MFYLDEAAIAPFLGIERAFSPQDIDCRAALDGTHNIWLLGGGRVDCDGWNLRNGLATPKDEGSAKQTQVKLLDRWSVEDVV